MAERLSLTEIEQRAAARGLLLRLQVKQLLAVTTLRVVVARPVARSRQAREHSLTEPT